MVSTSLQRACQGRACSCVLQAWAWALVGTPCILQSWLSARSGVSALLAGCVCIALLPVLCNLAYRCVPR